MTALNRVLVHGALVFGAPSLQLVVEFIELFLMRLARKHQLTLIGV